MEVFRYFYTDEKTKDLGSFFRGTPFNFAPFSFFVFVFCVDWWAATYEYFFTDANFKPLLRPWKGYFATTDISL